MTTTTTNGAVLTAHEAIIQTASVTIQTLRVGKKQVTMGMFRQLPCRPLVYMASLAAVAEGAAIPLLSGTPWGHVNYWWEGVDRQAGYWAYADRHTWPSALHLVCQGEGSLWRSVVCQAMPSRILESLMARGYQEVVLNSVWRQVWEAVQDAPQLFIAV